MKYFNLLVFCLLTAAPVLAQHVTGVVYEIGENQKKTPLTGVNVYWAGTVTGTTTGNDGGFKLEAVQGNSSLVVSFVGYQPDTMIVNYAGKPLDIILQVNKVLKEVVIRNKGSASFLSRMDPINTYKLTGEEFKKAACCNLSESFETNATVDVSYSDAITGAKQIQLLGLAGIYSELMTENLPNLRGLAAPYGLEYIPGSWMESIQVSKGTSAVVNGFESVTGQINVDYKKPDAKEKFYFNALANNHGRTETNANYAVIHNKRWSTMLLVHANNNDHREDANNDGFLDHPLSEQLNLFHRWKYDAPKFMTQFGVKALIEDRLGGQNSFKRHDDISPSGLYGIHVGTNRYEAFWKGGLELGKPGSSLAFLTNATWHSLDAFYGLKTYVAEQKSLYGRLVYQSIFGDTRHNYSTGISIQHDGYDEVLNDSAFMRTEQVPGIFFQYTYTAPEKLSLIAGLRADDHNLYGLFFTPRVHVKYSLNEQTDLRASAGKGYRSANIFVENSAVLASSRKLIIVEQPRQEEAWNYGFNLARYFDIVGRELTLSADVYRTDFINQVVVDMDESVDYIKFYNLNGRSYANNFQVDAKCEVFTRLDVLAAFRYSDVRITQQSKLVKKPMVNKYKGLVNLSYTTRLKKWQFDLTTQFNGDARLPDTHENPAQYQRGKNSPAYAIVHTQVTKRFKHWEIYAGGENITNYTQKNPIIAADQPFSNYFDASIVWGPVMGSKYYLGVRYKIE